MKKIIDNYLLTVSTSTTMIKYDWKLKWWTDKPIQILGDKIQVLVCAGGTKFTEEELNMTIVVSTETDFGGTKVSKVLEKAKESTDAWYCFKGNIDIPKEFLSGEFKVHVSTKINNKDFALDNTSKIEEWRNEESKYRGKSYFC